MPLICCWIIKTVKQVKHKFLKISMNVYSQSTLVVNLENWQRNLAINIPILCWIKLKFYEEIKMKPNAKIWVLAGREISRTENSKLLKNMTNSKYFRFCFPFVLFCFVWLLLFCLQSYSLLCNCSLLLWWENRHSPNTNAFSPNMCTK